MHGTARHALGVAATTIAFAASTVAFASTAAAADTSLTLSLTGQQGPGLSSKIDYHLAVAALRATNDATIVIQLPSATTSATALSSGCTYAAAANAVTCHTGPIAGRANVGVTFSANLGLLALGDLTAVATNTASDPVNVNPVKTSTLTCTALTSLLITCPDEF